jgi:hypothetical protein
MPSRYMLHFQQLFDTTISSVSSFISALVMKKRMHSNGYASMFVTCNAKYGKIVTEVSTQNRRQWRILPAATGTCQSGKI